MIGRVDTRPNAPLDNCQLILAENFNSVEGNVARTQTLTDGIQPGLSATGPKVATVGRVVYTSVLDGTPSGTWAGIYPDLPEFDFVFSPPTDAD
jgi:hypothetical protein